MKEDVIEKAVGDIAVKIRRESGARLRESGGGVERVGRLVVVCLKNLGVSASWRAIPVGPGPPLPRGDLNAGPEK
jgi:hypothetical protein